MRTQVNTLSDPIPSAGDLLSQCFRSWHSRWKKLALVLGIVVLTCVFSCICQYCGYGSCTQKDTKGLHPCWWIPLLIGHIVEEGGIRKFQSQSPGVDFWWYGIKVSRPGQFFLNVKTQHSVCRGSSKGLTWTMMVSLASYKEEINM